MKLFKQKQLSEDEILFQQWTEKHFIAVVVHGMQIPYWICKSCYCNISDTFTIKHSKACHVDVFKEIEPLYNKTFQQEGKSNV